VLKNKHKQGKRIPMQRDSIKLPICYVEGVGLGIAWITTIMFRRIFMQQLEEIDQLITKQ
jgi:hypothetical protein